MSGKSCPILPPLWSLWRVESVATGITASVSGGGGGGGQGPPLGPPPLPQQLWVEVWVPLCVLTATHMVGVRWVPCGGCFLAGAATDDHFLQILKKLWLWVRGTENVNSDPSWVLLPEVVWAHKPFVAHGTLEVLLPCMCPEKPNVSFDKVSFMVHIRFFPFNWHPITFWTLPL